MNNAIFGLACCEGARCGHNHWHPLLGDVSALRRRMEVRATMHDVDKHHHSPMRHKRSQLAHTLYLKCLSAHMGSMAFAARRLLMMLAMSDGHYSIFAPCAMCYSNLNPSRILYHSSYHVISARGRSIHPGNVRRVSNKCLTMQDLTPEPSMAVYYVFVAATGKYTCPRMIIYPPVLLALIIFDTLLSLPSEIKYIWYQKPRLGSILYTLARYSTIAFSLIQVYTPFFLTSLQVCENKGFIYDICAHRSMHLVWYYFSLQKRKTHIDEGNAIPWFIW